MIDYLLTCTLISSCILITLQGLKNAPARLNFYLLMIVLLCWFVPWQFFSQLPMINNTTKYVLDVSNLGIDIKVSSLQALNDFSPLDLASISTERFSKFSLNSVLVFLVSVGFLIFTWRILAYTKLIRYLHLNSKQSNSFDHISTDYPIRVTRLSDPGIATGLLRPVIWIETSMENRDEIESVIQHEITHLQQGDIYWTWLICCLESFFWWNPLYLKTAQLAKQQLELSCDEKCKRKLKNKYQLDLASLLLSQHKIKRKNLLFGPPILSVAHSKSFNIQRIKLLNKEKTMKSKYLIIATVAMSVSGFSASQIVDSNTVEVQRSEAVLEKTVMSEEYNAQLALLLKGAVGAKSDSFEQLKQAAESILQWHQSRHELSTFEESDIKLLSFTLITHIYHKLGQYQDALNAYDKWYKPGSNPEYFLKNVISTTYMQLGRYELAIEELESLADILQDNLQPGTIMGLARAYIEVANYDKALNILSHSNAGDDAYSNIYRYYIYEQLNNRKKTSELKGKIPESFAVSPALLPGIGIPGSPLLKLI